MNGIKGVQLTLMIGSAIPTPAPQILVEALTNVQVTNSKDRSGFQLTFTVGKNSPIVTQFLPTGYFDPIVTRVVLVVTMNGQSTPIMDGLVTNQEFGPSNEAGKTTLTLTGQDLSLAMDLAEKVVPFKAFPDAAKIQSILAPYAVLGITPVIAPPIISSVNNPTRRWETQSKMTDRAYINQVAERCGYVFYIQPGPLPGKSIAYFGPEFKSSSPQKGVSINFDAHSNAESISFSLDGLAKKERNDSIMDPFTNKTPIPVSAPNVSASKPSLGARPSPPAKLEYAKDAAKAEPEEAARNILGVLINNNNGISASGSLDVMRYKQILRAHMLVGVRGAGLAYDGLYYVDSVTHNIKKGEYKQNFTLSRDGLISNTPNIMV